MPNNAGDMLRTARKKAGMSQLQVYLATRISESNLQRWEVGESRPNLEDLYTLEMIYHAPGLWSQYLLATSPAYAAHHPAAPEIRVPLARVVGIGKEAEDMKALQDRVERDLLDGQIDDRATWEAYVREVRDVNAATGALLLEQATEEG